MIFTPINKLHDKSTKSFFVEKIGIYIRLVECYAEYRNLCIKDAKITNNVIEELIAVGIINHEADITTLKQILRNEIFVKLVNSVMFYLHNRDGLDGIILNLHNTKREKLQAIKNDKPTVVDFFCGAGGLSAGLTQAGYRVVLANDIEDVCCETYRYNHPELKSNQIINGDIRSIVDNIDNYIHEDIDMVVGGPPCQGFSTANRQRLIDDPRNHLYKYFIKAVSIIAPKVVIMENVKGMLSVADQVVADYESIITEKNGVQYTYKAAYKLLNANDYGVAQNRQRLIYIAIRNDIVEKNTVSPDALFDLITSVSNTYPSYTLDAALDSIKPLESPRIKNMTEVDDEVTGKKIDVNKHITHNNKYISLINQNREIPFVFNHKARYVNDINYEIFATLDQGEDATSPRIKEIMPYAHRNHCFKDKYFKLVANRPSRTITAHMKMDCLSHIHPFQVRSITPREAARIQSFPDDYMFLGAYLKTYMQIGNAVPPLLAKTIANIIKPYL